MALQLQEQRANLSNFFQRRHTGPGRGSDHGHGHGTAPEVCEQYEGPDGGWVRSSEYGT